MYLPESKSREIFLNVRKVTDSNSRVFQTEILGLVNAYFQILCYFCERYCFAIKKYGR